MNNTHIPEDIRQYLDNILQEAGMLTLDDKAREAMIQELFYQLDTYLASVIVKELNPEDLEKFVKMNEEKKSKEEIEAFVKHAVPNAQQIFSDAFGDFRDLYLENVETARDKRSQSQ
jgi:hypothetical protein